MSSSSPTKVENKNSQMKPVKLLKKHHMMKDRIGLVKTSIHNLPPDPNHVYGFKPPQDVEGTGEIISNWVTANPSLQKESQLSWINSNVLAVQHGCISAVEMRLYAEAHPNIRMKEVLNLNSTTNACNHEGPFGIKTKFAEESFKGLIQGTYTDYSAEDSDYPDTSNIMKLSSFPSPVPTKASIALAATRQREKAKSESPDVKFCMRKFQNVPGKISTSNSPVRSSPTKLSINSGRFSPQRQLSGPASPMPSRESNY